MHPANQLNNAIISHSGIEIRRAKSQADLDACLRVRHDVFTIEQGIDANLDNDGYDEDSIHYLALTSDKIPVGTLRAISMGSAAKIGRVAVLTQYRRLGIGSLLMQTVIADLSELVYLAFTLHSQVSAVPFYQKLGFVREGDEFDEAGIPHVAMRMDISAQGYSS